MKSFHSKLGAIVGSIVVAFAITLFIPSIASATYSSYYTYTDHHDSYNNTCDNDSSTTDCAVYEQKAAEYKNKADYYLAKYNSTYCYTYYQYYLHYMNEYNKYKKLADECNANSTVNCDPYKEKADEYKKYADYYKCYMDKYYALYQKCNFSCYYYYYTCYKKKYDYYMNLYNEYQNKYDGCINDQMPKTGDVCGAVFEDKDGDETFDEGEGAEGIIIDIMDSEGTVVSVTTDENGSYCLKDVLAGSVTVTTHLPEGAEQVVGYPEDTIEVIADQENQAGVDGYIMPMTTGTACGTILVDGSGYENATVNVTDANNETHTVTTDSTGEYCIAELPLGNATFTVDVSTLPYGVEQVQGEDPTTITVEASLDNDAGIDGYEIRYGKTCGVVLLDSNRNGIYDTDDEGIEGVTVEITDSENVVRVRQTDANGLWCVNALAGGEAMADIIESTLPENAVQVYGLDPNPIMVTVGQYTTGEADGFIIDTLTCPTGYEKLLMTVFTSGRTSSENLQTVLPIDITTASSVTFANVHTSNYSTIDQPYEQFKIAAVDTDGNLLANTGWTTDINNATLEDEYTNLGTITVSGADQLLLVHRVDPEYGDIISEDGNSVSFNGLCYSISEDLSFNP